MTASSSTLRTVERGSLGPCLTILDSLPLPPFRDRVRIEAKLTTQLVTHEIDIRVGGVWRIDMIAPDGTVLFNRMRFLRIQAPRLIEFIHGEDVEDDPDAFRMRVTFDKQDNVKTAVTLRQMHPTAERRAIVIGFGATEYGAQT